MEPGERTRAIGWACFAMLASGCATAAPAPKASQETVVEAPPSQEIRPDSDNGCPEQPQVTLVLSVSTPDGPRWMLHDRRVEGADDPLGGPKAGSRKLTVDEAKALSVSATGGVLWVFFEEEAPPCRMEAGTLWAMRHGDDSLSSHLAYEVHGDCGLSHERESYIALRGAEDVRGCRSHGLPTIASDPQGEGKEMPEGLEAVLPDNTCEGPNCLRWILQGVHLDDGTGIYEAAAVWVHPPEANAPPCATPFDGFHEAFYQPSRGEAWQTLPDTHGVRALLYDNQGLRSVVTDWHGELGVLTNTGQGGPVDVSRKRYTFWNEENQAGMEAIQPSCL